MEDLFLKNWDYSDLTFDAEPWDESSVCGLKDLVKRGAYIEPSGYNGRELGSNYYLITHRDQTAKWRHRGILSVVSNKHLGEEISKGTHLKTG